MKFGEKKRRHIAINITSLIDVLFLLLIFFLVTSSFMEHPGIKLDLPGARSSTPQKQEALNLSVKPDGTILVNETIVSLETLEDALKELRTPPFSRTVVLRADKRVGYGIVIRIMDAVRLAGYEEVVAFTALPES